MKHIILALSLLSGASLTSASPAPISPSYSVAASTPVATTLELDVVGLNCALCSEEMKTKLKALSGASDIEPRLECGKIYLDMPSGTRLNDRSLAATLLQNGFTYGGAKPAKKTMAEVRKTSAESCS